MSKTPKLSPEKRDAKEVEIQTARRSSVRSQSLGLSYIRRLYILEQGNSFPQGVECL